MDGRSRSNRSRSKNSSSAASLLSQSNLELVLDLIDSHYISQNGPARTVTAAPAAADYPADLLGNLGPSVVPSITAHRVERRSRGTVVATLKQPPVPAFSAAASSREGASRSPASEVDIITARALSLAKADGKQLEELLVILDKAPTPGEAPSSSPSSSTRCATRARS